MGRIHCSAENILNKHGRKLIVKMDIRKCVNCGAPLEGRKCSYCGTMYSDSGVMAAFDEDECTGTLTIVGNEYKVYLGSMEAFPIFGIAGRDEKRRFQTKNGRLVHKFTLIEM